MLDLARGGEERQGGQVGSEDKAGFGIQVAMDDGIGFGGPVKDVVDPVCLTGWEGVDVGLDHGLVERRSLADEPRGLLTVLLDVLWETRLAWHYYCMKRFGTAYLLCRRADRRQLDVGALSSRGEPTKEGPVDIVGGHLRSHMRS
jgi:hypothetical protein